MSAEPEFGVPITIRPGGWTYRSFYPSAATVALKPWYAFHETPPLLDILQPKILCKDISSRPYFLVDEAGTLVPRHSVYYIVPTEASRIHELCEYLNSETVLTWLVANCQRAANGFLRLQSHVLKRIPLPERLVSTLQFEMVEAH